MADRPILFSGPMVRAIIEGRKTQTRRIIEPHEPAPLVAGGEKPAGNLVTLKIPARHGGWMQGPTFKLKYAPGDRLWVREAWTDIDAQPHCDLAYAGMTGFAYRATDDDEMTIPPRWRPGIHMRRVDSRLTLLVTAVRVERLQDISEANAIAEGCKGKTAHQITMTICRQSRSSVTSGKA